MAQAGVQYNNYLYAVSSLTRSIAITVLGCKKDPRVLRESGRILQPVKTRFSRDRNNLFS